MIKILENEFVVSLLIEFDYVVFTVKVKTASGGSSIYRQKSLKIPKAQSESRQYKELQNKILWQLKKNR